MLILLKSFNKRYVSIVMQVYISCGIEDLMFKVVSKKILSLLTSSKSKLYIQLQSFNLTIYR